MLGYLVLGFVSAGVIVILFRFIQQNARLDHRLRSGDVTLLNEKGFNIDHVTQAPIGTKFFPPGTKLILSGQAAVDLQNNLRREQMDGSVSGTGDEHS